MRVGVDATCWFNPRGFGRFARNAVGRLIELDRDNSYVLYADRGTARPASLPSGAEQRLVGLSSAPEETLDAGAGRSVRDLLRLTRAASTRDLDAFLFPSVFSYFPALGMPTIVGVHDATAAEYGELVLPGRRQRALWRAKEWLALRRATQLFTVSHSAQAALATHLGLSAEQLPVVGEAPAPIFYPREAEQASGELAALGLSAAEPFVLCAGGINPHKNVDTLLHAYAQLGRARSAAPSLVIVGALEGSYVPAGEHVRALVTELELTDQVRLPGFVSDEALACLYSSAAAVVIPSLAEGFGLPAVEAAACGAPVVVSDIPAHRETLGDGALFFAPRDRSALAAAVGRLLDDASLREDLGRRGRAAVARFSWDETALRLRDLIVGAVDGHARSRTPITRPLAHRKGSS